VLLFAAKLVFYYACSIPFIAILSVRQEQKIWKRVAAVNEEAESEAEAEAKKNNNVVDADDNCFIAGPLTMIGILKVYIFNIFWMTGSLLGTLSLLPMWISRGCGPSVELEANAVMEKLCAMGTHMCVVGNVEVKNRELLPKINLHSNANANATSTPAPVFIANHCSQLDVSTMYFVLRRFKWIAKQSVRYIPGAGNIMVLSGHIFIKRDRDRDRSKSSEQKKNTSISDLYEQSNHAIQSGIPMMFFPQGTRNMVDKLPFKDGAFKVAIDNESLIVPISIYVPPNAWNSWYPLNKAVNVNGIRRFLGMREIHNGNVRADDDDGDGDGDEIGNKIVVTVHEPIRTTKNTDRKELKEKCQDIIYSVLPPLYHGHGHGHVHDGSNMDQSTKDQQQKKSD